MKFEIGDVVKVKAPDYKGELATVRTLGESKVLVALATGKRILIPPDQICKQIVPTSEVAVRNTLALLNREIRGIRKNSKVGKVDGRTCITAPLPKVVKNESRLSEIMSMLHRNSWKRFKRNGQEYLRIWYRA
jgi:hypothetical protein